MRGHRQLCVFWVSGVQTESTWFSLPSIRSEARGQLTEIETDPNRDFNFDLSPDGSRIALSEFDSKEGRIRFLPVAGGNAREVTVKGWVTFTAGPDWTPDGEGVFVSSWSPRGATLLHVDLEGNAHALWEQKGLRTWGVPSPDGRHLAMLGWTLDSNVWMMENF